MSSCCPGCAHEEACGHAEVTMCANREPATGYERVPGTPGCSCDGLRDALAVHEHPGVPGVGSVKRAIP